MNEKDLDEVKVTKLAPKYGSVLKNIKNSDSLVLNFI